MKKRYRHLIEAVSILAFIGLVGILPLWLLSEKPQSIEINSDKDFQKYNFPGDGSFVNPYIIENLTISEQLKRGISITNTNKYFIIRNCYIYGNLLNGIRLDTIAAGTGLIFNNTIQEHSQAGILISTSNNISIIDNIIIESKYKIWLNNSDYCWISNNYLFAYRPPLGQYDIWYRGIYSVNSFFTRIDYNTIQNTAFGMYISNGDNSIIYGNLIQSATQIGIYLSESTDCNITSTTCLDSYVDSFSLRNSNSNLIQYSSSLNGLRGLKLKESDENTISYCIFDENDIAILLEENSRSNLISFTEFTSNSEVAIQLNQGRDNIIHHNSFIDNNNSVEYQVEDHSTNNTWYDEVSSEGNYWHGWNSSLPYQIPGSVNSSDPYPLSEPIVLFPSELISKLYPKKTFNLEEFFRVSELYHDRWKSSSYINERCCFQSRPRKSCSIKN